MSLHQNDLQREEEENILSEEKLGVVSYTPDKALVVNICLSINKMRYIELYPYYYGEISLFGLSRIW